MADHVQYIPRNMHTVFALLCFVVVMHWLIFPYPSGLLHWHCGNLTIAPVPAKQPWLIWINTSCEFIMNDCITTTKQSTTKPCAYFLGYTVIMAWHGNTFCITSPLWGESGDHFDSHQKTSYAELWLICLPVYTVKNDLIWCIVMLMWRHCFVWCKKFKASRYDKL